MPEAFFAVDGDSYLPGKMTRGPWGAAMGGQIVGGLLGWGIERSVVDPGLQPARFTVDLLRPVLLEPVQNIGVLIIYSELIVDQRQRLPRTKFYSTATAG